jgi:capsular exopolysaccharide synthesis family protein
MNDTLSSRDLARILWRRRGAVLTVLLLGTAGAVLAIAWTPRSYVARAAILIEARLEPAQDGSGALVPLLPDSATIDSLAQVLASRSTARAVIAELGLAADPELGSHHRPAPLGGLMARAQGATDVPAAEAAVDRFLARLTVSREGKSHVVAVAYRSGDPDHAARVANGVARHFVAEREALARAAAERVEDALRARLDELEGQLARSESALAAARAGAAAAGPPTAATLAELSQLRRDLIAASAERQAAEARLERLRRARSAPLADEARSSQLDRLQELRADLVRREAELGHQLGERHPRLAELRAERSELDRRIAGERQRLLDLVADEVQVARTREEALATALESLHAAVGASQQDARGLTALEQRVERDRRLVEAQLARISASSGPAFVGGDARLISEATVPAIAVSPNPAMLLTAGLTSSLLIGLFAAFALDQADRRLRTAADVRAALDLPLIAMLPELRRKELRGATPHDLAVEQPASAFAEALRGVLMALDPRRTEHGARVVLVTSSVPGEGKSTLSLALARAAAAEGLRVLLIDGDLRRPRLAPMLGIEPALGLAELGAGRVGVDDVLRADPLTSVRLLPGSAVPGPPTGLLGDGGIPAVLKAARAAYDLVVVDTAPLLPVADAARMALVADRVLLLARWGRTSGETAAQAVQQLGVARERVAGVILSRVDLRRHRAWSSSDVAVAYGRYRAYYAS